MNKFNQPNHIALIMDGNGRWAQSRRLPRVAGHKKGVVNVLKNISGFLVAVILSIGNAKADLNKDYTSYYNTRYSLIKECLVTAQSKTEAKDCVKKTYDVCLKFKTRVEDKAKSGIIERGCLAQEVEIFDIIYQEQLMEILNVAHDNEKNASKVDSVVGAQNFSQVLDSETVGRDYMEKQCEVEALKFQGGTTARAEYSLCLSNMIAEKTYHLMNRDWLKREAPSE